MSILKISVFVILFFICGASQALDMSSKAHIYIPPCRNADEEKVEINIYIVSPQTPSFKNSSSSKIIVRKLGERGNGDRYKKLGER